MKQNKTFKNTNIFWLIFGVIVCLFVLWIDSGLRWRPKTREKTGKEILYEVGMGYANTDSIKPTLTPQQKAEIRDLINQNPSEHNEAEKSLLTEKSVQKILYEVAMGYTNPDSIRLILTTKQKNEIRDLINNNPLEYNETVKSLLKEQSGEKILYEVGMGRLNPKNVKLSPQQRKEITDLINKNPSLHNEAEKSLILKK